MDLKEQIAAFGNAIEGATALVLVLVRDLQETAGSCGTQRERRAYVRASLTMVEGAIAGLKQLLRDALPVFGADLTPGERTILQERSFVLRENGEVEEKDLFLRTLPNLRFTLAIGSKVFEGAPTVDYGSRGWLALRAAVALRNRLTHPKALADLEVSEDEIRGVVEATLWFRDAAIQLMRAADEATRRRALAEGVDLTKAAVDPRRQV